MVTNFEEFINEGKYTHKHLSSRFWELENGEWVFNEEVRKKLLKIAKDFYKALDIDLPIVDIKLTGSLANYNYTDKSDLDVHIIIDFSKYDGNKDVLNEMLRSKSFIWNLKHDINIKGADVELYVQDVNEKHEATGLFSLKNNKWIKKPKYTDPQVDEDDIEDKYKKWVEKIDELEKHLNDDMTEDGAFEYFNKAEKLKRKVLDFRQKGLYKGNGEYSVENLVYKKLRNRNNNYIDKLFDISYKYYDKIFSE
jgi:hypothetical protein